MKPAFCLCTKRTNAVQKKVIFMREYAKTPVDNVVTVKSIATALRADLRNRISATEQHDFPEVFSMAEGRGHTVVNGTLHHLEAGQIIIYAANSVHGEGSGGIADVISFETAAPLPDECCDRVITLTAGQRVLLHQIMEQTIPLFEERIGVRGMVLKNHVDPYAVQNTKNRLELFLLEIIHPGIQVRQDGMNAVTDYMMRNIHRSLSLAEMSGELGMSASSLKRLVQETCGKSPSAYFAALKIEEARRLLRHSAMNMSEIADRLGFSSVHYFSRAFRRKTGQTPSEYRKDIV